MEPGWHPDPSRRHELRWHDGLEWTVHVSDDGRHGVDAKSIEPISVDHWGRTGNLDRPRPAPKRRWFSRRSK
jgi:hypothetical protein